MSSLNPNCSILDTPVIPTERQKRDFSFKKKNNKRFMCKQKSHQKGNLSSKISRTRTLENVNIINFLFPNFFLYFFLCMRLSVKGRAFNPASLQTKQSRKRKRKKKTNERSTHKRPSLIQDTRLHGTVMLTRDPRILYTQGYMRKPYAFTCHLLDI